MTAPDLSTYSKEMRDNLRKVDFGMQVQAFLKSRIGKYIQERATSEIDDLTTKLKQHPVLKDPEGAAVLQVEIMGRELLLYWLGDVVREGTQLMEQMMAEERQALGLGDVGSPGGDPTGT